MSKNLSHLSGRKGLDFNLFDQLGIAAKESGTTEPVEMERIRHEFLFGNANVYGTVSFYDFLKEENKGKKAYVCNGSACMTAGTQPKVKTILSQYYTKGQCGEMTCLGRCHENSAFHINGKNYSGRDIDKIMNIVGNDFENKEFYHQKYHGTPVIMDENIDLGHLENLLAKILNQSADKCLDELKTSGLRGRGGAGFPIAFKLNACKDEKSETKFIVCNADEGDPGAYSDRYIMEQKPMLLLFGMIISGYITNARSGVVYIRGEYPESVETITNAIHNLQDKGLVGNNILNSGFDFHFKVIKAQGAYICGEETALLSSIEGQRPEVRVRPPFPTQQGLFNQPTVVNNVETLACIPFVMSKGGQTFSSLGKGKSTGTKLISLDSHFHNPGIYEVEMGTALSYVIHDLGGGFKSSVKAMHIGGPLGGIVPVSKIGDLSIDFESFSANGFLLGHASVVCIPTHFPMIEYLKHLFKFTAHESCGKCFPCRIGSTRGYEMLEKATSSEYKIDINLMIDLLETLEVGSLCALGGGLPLPIKNAMMYFDEELFDYFKI